MIVNISFHVVYFTALVTFDTHIHIRYWRKVDEDMC